jgi:hypothetical protein
LVFIIILLNLPIVYVGYCIAYITAVGANSLVEVYGPTIGNANVRAACIVMIPYGVAVGIALAIVVLP